jgi:site-specific DNA-cytosine methylase
MNILSLFDGISCARVALEGVGIPITKYYASEIDKNAMAVAMKNYPDTTQLGSVTEVNGLTFHGISRPRIDLLIGGSPCQDLSIAQKNRKGLDGERSGLFWEYVRILKEAKPRWFILEKVTIP